MADPQASEAVTPSKGLKAMDGLFVIGVALIVLGLLGVASTPFIILGVLCIVMAGGNRLRRSSQGGGS